jgi:hypothetical protein
MILATLLLAAGTSFAADLSIPASYKACAKDLDCAMASEGDCCGRYAAIGKSSEPRWSQERAKALGGSCTALTACPASVDPTPWTKIAACIKGTCQLREIRADSECSKVPALYLQHCLGALNDRRTAGTCFYCLGKTCPCPEDGVAYTLEEYPEHNCRDNIPAVGTLASSIMDSPAFRRLCGLESKVPVSTCFKLGRRLERFSFIWLDCPAALPRRIEYLGTSQSTDSLKLIRP